MFVLCSKLGETWLITVVVLKQCMIMQGWIFPFMGFEPVLILNGDLGSVSILSVGMGQDRGYELSVLLLRVLSSSSSEESPP